jgi:hypothetical protein
MMINAVRDQLCHECGNAIVQLAWVKRRLDELQRETNELETRTRIEEVVQVLCCNAARIQQAVYGFLGSAPA